MQILNTGFTALNDDDFFHLAIRVTTNVATIPIFAPLYGQLPPIKAAAEGLQTATAMPYGPARDASVAAARTLLTNLLQTLADDIESTEGATDSDFARTGYGLRKKPTHTSAPPDQPQNVRLKVTGTRGELQVMAGAVDRALFYEVQYTQDPNAGPWTTAPGFTSTRAMVLTGLKRGKDYYVQVRAVASGQVYGQWSDLASLMVM